MSSLLSMGMIWAALAGAQVARPAVSSSPEPASVHRIVAAATLPVLPDELRAFFDRRLDGVVAAAVRFPPRVRKAERTGDEFPARTIERSFVELRDAFRSDDVSAIESSSGRLLYLVADAALRFRRAKDTDRTPPDNLSWSDHGSPSSVRLDRTLPLRIAHGAMARLQTRLAYEVRVAPTRYARMSDPYAMAERFVGDAEAALSALARADVGVMHVLGIEDAEGFASKREEYFRQFTHRAAPVLEDRLEAAVLLYANLVGTAWEDAGMPELGVGEAQAGRVSRATSADAARPVFVGSRHSQVFHKPTCPHVRRIKPENLVRFGSAAAAKKVGRTPCRTCKPTSP